MGGWAALCILLLRLACQARPAASALELGYWPKGRPLLNGSYDDVPTAMDIGVLYRTDPDYPDRASPTVIVHTTLDNWWKETVDEVLVLPKGHPLGNFSSGSNPPSYYYKDSNQNTVLNTSVARWSLRDDLTLRVQLASPEKAHRIGELAVPFGQVLTRPGEQQPQRPQPSPHGCDG